MTINEMRVELLVFCQDRENLEDPMKPTSTTSQKPKITLPVSIIALSI